jgi:hypothetical protein
MFGGDELVPRRVGKVCCCLAVAMVVCENSKRHPRA